MPELTKYLESSQEKGKELKKLVERAKGGYEAGELTEEERELLKEVDKRGRLGVMTSVGIELGKDRGTGSGFQGVIDEKYDNQSANLTIRNLMHSETGRSYYGGRIKSANNSMEVFEKEGINASVEIGPLVKQEAIYKEETVERGMLFWKTKEKVSTKVGIKEKPVLIGDLNGDKEDMERAYRIFYYVQGGRENPYLDPSTGRGGVIFQGHIMLPESIAKKAFLEIQKDPSFIKDILRTLDPKLMEEQENSPDNWSDKSRGPMPKVSKILVIPEGSGREDIFEIDKNNTNIASGIKRQNIKECLEF